MDDFTCIFRNYISSDFNSYIRLHIEAEKLDAAGRCTSLTVLGEHLDRPSHRPEQDLFVAEADGDVIGYIDITPEPGIGRVVLDCLIQPEHRGKGLATKLSGYAERRVKEIGVRVIHVNISQDNIAARNLLTKLGFGFIRRHLQLRLYLSEIDLPDFEQFAPTCCHFQYGEEDKLTRIQNRSFAGHWGFNPNTVEEIGYWINSSTCSPGNVIKAIEAGNITGYCWTKIKLHGSVNKGLIHMIGVDPNYRGKGIGRMVLLAGLSYLKSREVEVVELTVDSQNKAACTLYNSVGFKISSVTLWYEKLLD